MRRPAEHPACCHQHCDRDDCGAELVGYWSTEGYEFVDSLGIEGGKFMGLSLDDGYQGKLTEARVKVWVQQLIAEFALEPDSINF